MNELILTKELTGLPESKAAQIQSIFEPMVQKIKSFEEKFNALMLMEDGDEKAELAGELRLEVADTRIKADKARKLLKEPHTLINNAIQAVFNIVKFATVPMEDKLKEVETYHVRQEAERIDELGSERKKEIKPYCVSDKDFAEQTVAKLGYMADSVWPTYFLGKKTEYEAIKEAKRKEAEEHAPDKEKVMHMVKVLRDGRCGLTSPAAKTAVNLATEILVDYTSKAGSKL